MSNRSQRLAAPAVVQGKDDAGQPIFSVLAKRTYDVSAGSTIRPAALQKPLLRVNENYEDSQPDWEVVRRENELAPFKNATDVVVLGSAFAPGAKPVEMVEASVLVGDRGKRIRVTGDRRCEYRSGRTPGFRDPVPFTEMPVRYDRAYGGRDVRSEPAAPFFYPRNPVGRGVVLRNVRELVDGLPLPNIEDPDDFLTPERLLLEDPARWVAQPLPDGFGWFHPSWYPRCTFTGAYPAYLKIDTPVREEALGMIPNGQVALALGRRLPGFDNRYFQGASRGLSLTGIKGDETVELTNLSPDGALTFRLPGDKPVITLDIGFGEQALEPMLQTVLVRTPDCQVDLVWRGSCPYPGWDWLPEMTRLEASAGWQT